jgi:hypothetical protein
MVIGVFNLMASKETNKTFNQQLKYYGFTENQISFISKEIREWLKQKRQQIIKRELKEDQWYGSPIINELLEELK